jgi:hypothetical protein
MLNRYIANPTQLTGLVSFAASAITCLLASRWSGSRDARVWSVLALANILFFVEVFAGARHRLTLAVISALAADGYYWRLHGAAQAALIIIVAVVGASFAAWILSMLHGSGRTFRLAAALTVLVATLFAVEVVSLHQVDAIFYRPLGPVLAIGWAWAVAATVISLAAIASIARRPDPRNLTD